MQLKESAEEKAFRRSVEEFVSKALPPRTKEAVLAFSRLTKAQITEWHQLLYRQGWGAPGWPVDHGGTGWSPAFRRIFDEETYRGGAPRLMPFVNMIGPILQHYGTAAQQERFLPKILRMEEWWCQGYSEPGAGSDLAALRMSARRDGNDFIINGRKIWTSFAAWSDWMFALVRTSSEGKPQAGITFLLIDMRSPGIQVRAIATLNGDDDVAEVVLDDVVVPVANVVGEVDAGWAVAKHLLGHERTEVALVGPNKRLRDRVRHVLARAPLAEFQRATFRRRLARLEMRLIAQEWLLAQVLTQSASASGATVSVLKIQGVEIAQDLAALLLEIVGPAARILSDRSPESAAVHDPAGLSYSFGASELYFDARRHSVYGGTSEIQKNIVGKSVVGA